MYSTLLIIRLSPHPQLQSKMCLFFFPFWQSLVFNFNKETFDLGPAPGPSTLGGEDK